MLVEVLREALLPCLFKLPTMHSRRTSSARDAASSACGVGRR